MHGFYLNIHIHSSSTSEHEFAILIVLTSQTSACRLRFHKILVYIQTIQGASSKFYYISFLFDSFFCTQLLRVCGENPIVLKVLFINSKKTLQTCAFRRMLTYLCVFYIFIHYSMYIYLVFYAMLRNMLLLYSTSYSTRIRLEKFKYLFNINFSSAHLIYLHSHTFPSHSYVCVLCRL